MEISQEQLLIFSFVNLVLLVIAIVVAVINSRKYGKIKEIDKEKDEFISMAAHELRAPLTAIKGYLSMIVEGDTGEVSAKTRGFVADALSVNERLVRLVNNMLNVSRIEQGKLAFQMDNLHLARAARGAFDTFRAEAERKGLEFSLEIPEKISDEVYVDPDKIDEVIANLVSNAVKFTSKGFAKIKLSNPQEKVVRLEVIDSGPGISAEEQKKLFRKFYRVESTSGKTIGTGLGLYICKLLVEKFNGKIGLISSEGQGSTFWFELPLSNTASKSP
jgi:signal transduction histidine kinase